MPGDRKLTPADVKKMSNAKLMNGYFRSVLALAFDFPQPPEMLTNIRKLSDEELINRWWGVRNSEAVQSLHTRVICERMAIAEEVDSIQWVDKSSGQILRRRSGPPQSPPTTL
ncbi:MAG: hypothetical protein ACRED7_11530 [Stellaceae bacterium]